MADQTPRLGLGTFAQGDTDWDHTDTVETLDELGIDRGPIADRPAEGTYDDEFYFATDQQILWRWDADATDWVADSGRGSETDPLPGTVYREAVNTEKLPNAHGYRGVAPSDSLNDIQSVIDEYDKRDVTLLFKRGAYGTYTSPIGIGQLTKLVGEAALLDEQGDEYNPRPILNFDGTNGLETPSNATYRAQRPIIEEITLQGGGSGQSGTIGIYLQENASENVNLGKVGLPKLDGVYIEDFETGLDGDGVVDSLYVTDSHFSNVKNGILDIGSGLVEQSYFFDMDGADTVAVSRANTFENEFEPVNDGVRSIYAGDESVHRGNTFKTQYKEALFVDGAIQNVRFIGNTVKGDTTGADANRQIDWRGTGGAIAYNNFREATPDSGSPLIRLSSNADNIYVVGNQFPSGFASTVEVYTNECVLIGRFPDGVIDSGTRTLINGRGTNAGDPNTTGQWNGNAIYAYRMNATIEDTSNSNLYKSKSDGTWSQIGT